MACEVDVCLLREAGLGGTTTIIVSDVSAIALADMDGDGDDDLVVAHALDSSLEIFESNGTGGVLPHAPFALPAPARRVHAADVDDDGLVDIMVALGDDGFAVLFQNRTP